MTAPLALESLLSSLDGASINEDLPSFENISFYFKAPNGDEFTVTSFDLTLDEDTGTVWLFGEATDDSAF